MILEPVTGWLAPLLNAACGQKRKTRYRAPCTKRHNSADERSNTKHIRGVYVSVYRMIQVYMTGIQVIGGYPVVTTQQK